MGRAHEKDVQGEEEGKRGTMTTTYKKKKKGVVV
jgi:hypothetical protein